MRHRNTKGFTLIELLVVVAIIGIIAAIAIPNLLQALQRGKQKRSMSDIRSVGTAIETYQIDNGRSVLLPTETDVAAVRSHLEPTYIKVIPLADAWKSSLRYQSTGSDYSVKSFGKDGAAETDPQPGETRNFNCDIVFANGQFVRYPDGAQVSE